MHMLLNNKPAMVANNIGIIKVRSMHFNNFILAVGDTVMAFQCMVWD